jgi:polysaccharide deacetylase 2 family uncharacterized protein YibQ
MSILKLVLGFVLGIFACGILLALISIRSPILANAETLATLKVAQVSSVVEEIGEQKVNIQSENSPNTAKAEILIEDLGATLDEALESDIRLTPLESDNVDVKVAQSDVDNVQQKVQQVVPEPTPPKVVEQVPATVLKRAGNILTLGGGSSRLPSVSDAGVEPKSEQNSPVVQTSIFEANSNPLVDLDTPYLSIILVDIGSAGVSQADLLKQTLTLSFAVDGSRSDAGRVAVDYRTAGFEVVSLLNETEAEGVSTTEDAAKIVQPYLDAMPQALAVVDAPAARLQKNRRFLGAVLASIAEDAPGILTYKGGLNTATKAVREAGVPTGAISRYLDETYSSPSLVKRAIERATIDAARDGAAILMAVATPTVLQGLAQWADTNAASKVELVPLSSAMKRQSK